MKNILTVTVLLVTGCLLISACNQDKKENLPTSNTDIAQAQSKTIENLQAAYKDEMTATAKYAAYATKAETDGYHHIALLYNAVSASENIHAINHKAVIMDAEAVVPVVQPIFAIKSTKENLAEDVEGEAYEAKTMYPDYIKTAKIADNELAELSFTYAMKTEKKHNYFFAQVLGDVNTNTLNSSPSAYYVCPACGNTYTKLPKHCAFSLTDGNSFIKFE